METVDLQLSDDPDAPKSLQTEYWDADLILVKAEIPFKGKRRHGIVRTYNRDGMLITEANYDLGFRHGLFRAFYDTGLTRLKGQFENGFAHGIFTTYAPDGTVQSQARYRLGTLLEVTAYDETGKSTGHRVEQDDAAVLAAPALTGKWSGDSWGNIVFDGQTGSYSSTRESGPDLGEIQLWLGADGTYAGTFSEGSVRLGTLTLHYENDYILVGTWETDPDYTGKGDLEGTIRWERNKP